MRAAYASHVRRASENAAHEHTGSLENIRPAPRMALRLIRVRPGDRLSLPHHRERLSPPHDLTPAPGRQAHMTSRTLASTLVSRSLRVHRITPHGRDDRDRPLCRGRRAKLNARFARRGTGTDQRTCVNPWMTVECVA